MSKPKSWNQRVDDAFAADSTYAEKYLDLVYTTWQDNSRTARRTAISFVGLAVIFILLEYTKNAEVTLGPLRLTNVAAALTLIPAVASFLFFELVAAFNASSAYSEVMSAILGRLNSAIVTEQLNIMLYPLQEHIWEDSNWAFVRTKRPSGIAATLNGGLGWVTGVALLIGGAGFLVYSYVSLYEDVHASTLGISISLAFATLNMVRAGLEIVDAR